MRVGERELHAGAQRRIHVEAVVLVDGGEDLVGTCEHGRHAPRRRWGRGQEAHRGAVLLVGAIGGEGVQMPLWPTRTVTPPTWRAGAELCPGVPASHLGNNATTPATAHECAILSILWQ